MTAPRVPTLRLVQLDEPGELTPRLGRRLERALDLLATLAGALTVLEVVRRRIR